MANNSSPLPWLKFVAISARVSAQFFSYRNFVSLNISSLRLPKLTFRAGLKFGCDYMRRGTLGDFEHRNTAKKYCRTPHHRKKSRWNTVSAIYSFSHSSLGISGTSLLSFTIEKKHLTKLKNKLAALVHLK